MRFELMTSSLPRRRSTPELRGQAAARVTPLPAAPEFRNKPTTCSNKNWSGRRGSNSRPSAWKADALPTELHPPTQLRIAEFGLRNSIRHVPITNPHSEIRNSSWCRGQDSNLRRALARRVYSPVPLTARPPLQTHTFNNACRQGCQT